MLLNVYWERRFTIETYEYLIPLLHKDLEAILDSIQIIQKITKRTSHSNDEVEQVRVEITKAQQNIKKSFNKIKSYETRIAKLQDIEINMKLDDFYEDAKPIIDQFLVYDLEKNNPYTDEFENYLKQIRSIVQSFIENLNHWEEKNGR
jgi:hypothetical protein